MDISVTDDTDILISKDGTKWYEDMFVGNQSSTEISSINHGPLIADLCQNAVTPLGNSSLYIACSITYLNAIDT